MVVNRRLAQVSRDFLFFLRAAEEYIKAKEKTMAKKSNSTISLLHSRPADNS